MRGLVMISAGKIIQRRGPGHSVNRWDWGAGLSMWGKEERLWEHYYAAQHREVSVLLTLQKPRKN